MSLQGQGFTVMHTGQALDKPRGTDYVTGQDRDDNHMSRFIHSQGSFNISGILHISESCMRGVGGGIALPQKEQSQTVWFRTLLWLRVI